MLLREKILSAMKTELKFLFVIRKLRSPLIMKEKSLNKYKQLMLFKEVQYQKDTLYIIINTFISPIYTFPGRETYLFTRQINVQLGKSTIIVLFVKEKLPTLARNKHYYVQFFFHGPRLFNLSTEKVRVRSVRNGHQSGYSRADTINNDVNKRSKNFL